MASSKRNHVKRKLKRRKKTYQKRKKRGLRGKVYMCIILLTLALTFMFTHKEISVRYEDLAYLNLSNEEILKVVAYCEEKRQDPYVYMAAYLDWKEYKEVDNKEGNVDRFIEQLNMWKRHRLKSRFEVEAEVLKRVLSVIKAFPVNGLDTVDYYYKDTYGAQRTYGGKRPHLGTDVMDHKNQNARLEIRSMTDGVISNIGWNEKGGWRVGINTPKGDYFYYAHMDHYAKGLEAGMKVKANQLLGYMGDTGYGKEPGTRGKFDVHLHLGIMLRDINGEEYWVNPYHPLRLAYYRYEQSKR